MLKTSRLLRPVLFLSIKSKGLKKYTWLYPALWVFLVLNYIYFFPETCIDKSTIIKKMIQDCSNLLYVLPGFYIAALAAIATFNAPTMDVPLDGQNTELCSQEENIQTRKLTRRRFLCLLFGYLSFLSLILCVVTVIFTQMPPSAIFAKIWPTSKIYMDLFFITVAMLFFIQLICLTLLGLYYLCDRIHWRKPIYKA